MNRSFNPRFALGLVLVLGALGGGLYLLQSYQVTANAGSLKARSEKAEAEGDLWKAIGLLERYNGFRPDDKESAVRYASLFTRAAKSRAEQQRAYTALEQVLQDRPTDTDLRRQAADLALAIDRASDAKYHYDELLKGKPNDAELLEKVGLCEEQLGRVESAIARFEKAIAADPTRVVSYVRLAVGYRRQERADAADRVMDKLVAANPKNHEAHLARSEYLRSLGRVDEAAKAIADAKTLGGPKGADDRKVILAAAELASEQGKLDAARAEYERGRQLYPDDIRFGTGVASLDLKAGRRAAAVDTLKGLAKQDRMSVDDLWSLADLLITAGEPVEARKLMAKLPRTGPIAGFVDFLDARILFNDGKWVAATALLNKCRGPVSRLPDVAFRTELMLAACYERLDRPDKRLEAAQAAVKIDPTSVAARSVLADARLANGSIEEALTGHLQLAGRLASSRYAAIGIMTWQNRVKGSPAVWAEAEQLLAAAPEADKKTAEHRLAAAVLAAARGDRAAARKVLEEGRAADPTERRYWVGLAQLAGDEGGAAAAEKVLDEATAAAGDGADFRLARAGYRTTPGGADRLRPLEDGADKLTSADRERLLLGLADAYAAAGSAADTRRVMDELVRLKPDNLAYRIRQFDRLAADADPDQLAAAVDAIRKLEGDDGVGWLYADAVRLVRLLARTGDPTVAGQAKARLAEVAARRPGWATVPALKGEVDERTGRPDEALDHYLQAIKMGGRSPALVRRAVALLTSRRRYDEARQLLAEAPAAAAAPDLRRMAAELTVAGRDTSPDALKQAAAAVPADTKDPTDELWRGMVLWSAGQPADAEKAFRRAVSLNEADPAGWGALIRFLAQTGRKPDAAQAMAAAKGKVRPDQLAASLPQWLELVGDRAEAGRLYEEAFKKAPADPRAARDLALYHMAGGEFDKADPILRGLAEKAADTGTAIWARRTLALLLAGKGEYKLGTEALALLDANLKVRPDSPEDKRAQAIVLASRPGGRREAIQTLENSFGRLRPTPSEEFLLAQLYELDGNWPRAKERLLGLVGGTQANNVQFLAYTIAALLRHKEVDEADRYLARLEALPGQADQPRTVEMKARVLAARGNGAEAAGLLTAFAEKLYKTRPNPGVYRAVGLLLAELKQPAAAEGLVRKYVAQAEARNPAVALDLAEFLARQNRVADALQVVAATAGRGVAPEVIGRAAVGVVRLGKASDADYARAADLIAAARAAAPGSADLAVSTADLLDARGQYDAAIAAYREILAKDPGKPLALNNLAWLLALHANQPDEAVALADRAIAVVGPVDIYLDTRGVAHLRAGRPQQAVSDLTAGLEQAQRPDTLFHLALANEKRGSTAEAQRWFRKAVDAGLTEKDVHPLEQAEFIRLRVQFND